MNNNHLGPDVPLRKLILLASSNDSELQFMSEVSRKRKDMDSLPDNEICNIMFHPGNLSRHIEHLPPTDSTLPLPGLTPSLGASQSRTQGFPYDNEFISSRPTNAQSHFGDHPVCSMTSTLGSIYMKGATFMESANNSSDSFALQQNEQFVMANVTAPQVSVSTDARSSTDGIGRQAELSNLQSYVGMNLGHINQNISCTEAYLTAQGSYTGMNLGYENRDFTSKPLSCSMPSPCLQSVEPSKMKLFNKCSDLDGESLVKDFKESEITRTNGCCQYTDIADDSSTTKDTPNSAESYSVNKGKEDRGSHQNPRTYITQNEQIKSVAEKNSSVHTEKLWDGSLQLNTSTTVSTVAFFKSGEKAQDIRWCDLLEVKGKVRLQAFEKFIQELPRSRTRALMVISLCWKAGSSISGLTGMKEVAKVYQESERVGFAQICPGIDLYVCPRSETIITILAKFGFFKGMAAVEEDQNSLIGCVVWRRGCQSLDSASKASDNKINSLVEKALSSSEEILETNSPVLKKQDEHSKQTLLGTRQHDGMQCQHLPETRSNNADNASHMRTEIKSRESSSVDCSSKSVSVLHIASSLPYNSPIAPVQISPPQKQELRSKECLKNPLLCAVEGRQTVLGSEPARSLLLQSSQMLPESHQRNITCSESSTYPSSYPDTLMQSAPSMPSGSIPVRLQTTQKPFSSSQEDPTSSVSKDGNYIMYFKKSEAPATSSEPSQTTLPGPPPLPPEVLKRIIQARAAAVAKETNKGVVMVEIPVGHVSEPKKFSMVIGPSPVLPGPPLSLPQSLSVCPSPVDVDDLPEFDFSSTSKFIESPGNKYPWSSYPISEVHPFNKQLPSDMGHNLTPHGSTTMQPIGASQRHQFSYFPGEATNYYQENPKRTKFQKPIVDNKVVVRTSLSCDQPSLDADQGSIDPRYSSSSLRKYCWDDDDDDDMPEWCPPDLEHVDRTQATTAVNLSSPVHNWDLEFARRHSFISPLSTSSCPTGIHSLPRGYLHGRQGSSPLDHNPTAPVHTRSAAGFDHSIQRTPLVQHVTNLSGYQTSMSNKIPSDIGNRFRRP
ncbi:unnamed protein product [Musa banksii]